MIQLQFLNFLLTTKDYSLITNNRLDDSFFSEYKSQFNYILNHYNTYNNIPDKATFLSAFPDFEVIEVTENSPYLLEELYKDKNTRILANTFNDIRRLLINGDIDKAVAIYNNTYDNLSSNVNIGSINLLDGKERYEQYVDKCHNFNKYFTTTGLKELDDIIGGWDRNEEVATIVARPGVGKSWVLLLTALASAKQGLTVGLYSGEMSSIKVGYRLDTLASNISNTKLTKGNISIQNEYKVYLDHLKENISGQFKVLTPDIIGGLATVNDLKAFIEKDKLDILFIDQHSLLEDSRRGRTAVDKASNISKDLKQLQVLKGIPIISVSQQNRVSTAETGVSTEHIAQSDRISQDSTIILFLEQKDNVLTIYLVKSRDSSSNKKLRYSVDFDRGVLEYIPTAEEDMSEEEFKNIKQSYEKELEY